MDAVSAPTSCNSGGIAEAPESPPAWYKQLASQQWQPTALQWPLPPAYGGGFTPLSPPQAGMAVTCNVSIVQKGAPAHARQGSQSQLSSALWSTSSTASTSSSLSS